MRFDYIYEMECKLEAGLFFFLRYDSCHVDCMAEVVKVR